MYDLNVKSKRRVIRLKKLLLLLPMTILTVNLSAQNAPLSLLEGEMTVLAIIEQITAQTDYRVNINWGNLNSGKKIVLPQTTYTVEEALDAALKGTSSAYAIEGKHIVIYPAPAAPRPNRSAMAGFVYAPSRMLEVKEPTGDRSVPAADLFENNLAGYWLDTTGKMQEGPVLLHFRSGKSVLETDFMQNRNALEMIDATFSDQAVLSRIGYVTIIAGSSPGGSSALNEQLSRERALAVKSYIIQKYPKIAPRSIQVYSVGENWSAVRKMVAEDRNVPYRQQVLDIIDGSSGTDDSKLQIQKLGNGEAYHYITEEIFPGLQGGTICMVHFKMFEPAFPAIETVRIPSSGEIMVSDTLRMLPVSSGPLFIPKAAIKTNLLYDAILLPNLAVELPLGRKWSMEIEGMASQWKFDKKKIHRVLAGGVEFRKWFGRTSRTPLNGHYVGLYGLVGNYDLMWGNTGYVSEISYSAGLTYGYSMPIGQRLNLEFGLGIGYFGGRYKEFSYDAKENCYPWIRTRDRHYFGLTKAKVSLVWLIGTTIPKL